MLSTQHNARIHLFASIFVVVAGLFYGVDRYEWGLLILAIASVWSAEALNTAFEFLCDVSSPEFHPIVKNAKDVSAGAVLICAIGAVIIGTLVFAPYIFS
jgi:diacylglycerol kinase (ATP)